MLTGRAGLASAAMTAGARLRIGMHGELVDWVGQRAPLYHLGNGARSYDPTAQRFLRMDPFSPFSAGGRNPYAFCEADPVNRTDPSGYAAMSIQAGIGLAFGILGIFLTALTFGAVALPLTSLVSWLLMTPAVLGVGANVTGILSSVLEETHPEASRALGWASLGLGIAATVFGALLPSAGLYAKASGRLLVGSARKPDFLSLENGNLFLFQSRFRDGSLIATHGSRDAALYGPAGSRLSALDWSMIVGRYLNAYRNSDRSGPLYLLSCYATRNGRNSNAAIISSMLRRDVIAFDAPVSRMMYTRSHRHYLLFDSRLGQPVRFVNRVRHVV